MTAAAPAHQSTVMTMATALAAVEVVVAGVIEYYRTRGNRLTSLCVGGQGPGSIAHKGTHELTYG